MLATINIIYGLPQGFCSPLNSTLKSSLIFSLDRFLVILGREEQINISSVCSLKSGVDISELPLFNGISYLLWLTVSLSTAAVDKRNSMQVNSEPQPALSSLTCNSTHNWNKFINLSSGDGEQDGLLQARQSRSNSQ